MYKRSNRIILLCLFVLWGFTAQVFSANFSDALTQSAEDTTTAATLFAGKSQVSNVYSQALHIVKQNEISATDTAIRIVVAQYTRNLCKIDANDVLNILYYDDSDASFRIFFQHLLLTDMPSETPNAKALSSSYAAFFACSSRYTHPRTEDYTTVRDTIKSLYYQALKGVFYSSTLAQDNIGEDLFRNGNTWDSSFDLLADINVIGNLFFTTFKQAPEVLFYRLPKISTAWWSAWSGNNSSSWVWSSSSAWWSASDQNIPSWSSSSDWTRWLGVPPSPAPLWSTNTSAQHIWSPSSISPDADVQQFLTTNNPSTFVQPSTSFLVGGACAGTQQLPPSQAAVKEETQDPQVYISGLMSFINNANSDDIAHAMLLSWFATDFATIQKNTPSYQAQVQAISNSYASLAFGTGSIGNWPCESACVSLVGQEYIQCQLNCTKSCIQSCADLPLADKFLCVTDCSCKMISGPQWSWWKNVEDMYSVKFCKEPLPTISIPWRTTVTSIEWIFSSFLNALQWLKSSGQTTKISKTREFLDLWIIPKLSELLDFNIFVNFKPVWWTKGSAAQQRQQVLESAALANAQINQAATPDSDNYNKYIVLSDVAQNSADLEPAQNTTSAAQFQALQNASVSSLPNPIQLYQKQKSALLSEDIISFLWSQVTFWDQFYLVSNSLLQDAARLKNKINSSK